MNAILTDNLSIEAVKLALKNGLDPNDGWEIVIDKDSNSYSFNPVSLAGVQLEAILSILIEIVYSDCLYVGAGYEKFIEGSFYNTLKENNILKLISTNWDNQEFNCIRKIWLDRLCNVKPLKDAIEKNVEAFQNKGSFPFSRENLIVWGASGYLTRSEYYKMPYSGHPLRRRLIENVNASPVNTPHAIEIFSEWLDERRKKEWSQVLTHENSKDFLTLLPPVAIEIIENSRHVDDLIKVALQVRKKYSKLRKWISELQGDLENEDLVNLKKKRELIKGSKYGAIELKLKVFLAALPVKIKLPKFGIRAILERQIFSEKGEQSIDKLVRLFGEEYTGIGNNAKEYLKVRFLKTD